MAEIFVNGKPVEVKSWRTVIVGGGAGGGGTPISAVQVAPSAPGSFEEAERIWRITCALAHD
ncbi:MAG: hypothetical protein ACRYG8_24215 [Janthinobacterium lividum]